jgi:hypothetical protein
MAESVNYLDPLGKLLKEIKDPAVRRWLERLLTKGEYAEGTTPRSLGRQQQEQLPPGPSGRLPGPGPG